jgi:hypothetical protein
MHIRKPSAPFGISCHHQAVRKRRAAEAKSRLLLESVSNGIWELDLQGRVTFVNSAQVCWLHAGKTDWQIRHELVHHSYLEFHYPLAACPA